MYIGSLHWLLKSVIQGEERQEIHWLREDHPYTLGGHRSSPLLQEDLLTLDGCTNEKLGWQWEKEQFSTPPGQRKVVITGANESWL